MREHNEIKLKIGYRPRGFTVLVKYVLTKRTNIQLLNTITDDNLVSYYVAAVGDQVKDLKEGDKLHIDQLPIQQQVDESGKYGKPFIKTLKLGDPTDESVSYFIIDSSAIKGVFEDI